MSEAKRRQYIFNRGMRDPDYAANEFRLCKSDVLHFINNWGFTFDPRAKIAHIPFKLWDYQIEALDWLDERFNKKEVGVIEKSRDMGATWLITTWALHKWLFHDNFTCLFGSKTEGDVDSASIDSIFGKIRYQLYKLPPFLRPDMKVRIHEKKDADSYLSIINPINGNEISGDSANENFGRSGRRSVVFLDEYAFVSQSEKIWSAISEVSNVIIPVSTPNGKGNHFYTLRSRGTIPVLSLHWSRHPNKDLAWYENKKKTMEEWQVGQELDISYSTSRSGRVYPGFRREWHISNENIDINEFFEQFCTMDYGIRDAMVIIFGQIDVQNNVEIIGEFDATGFDIELFIYIIKGQHPPAHIWMQLTDSDKNRINTLFKKIFSGGIPYRERKVYGDHAGTARSANSVRSIKDRLYTEGGVKLNSNSKQDFANRIQCLGNLFKLKHSGLNKDMSSRIKVSPDCPKTIDALFNYVWSGEENSSSHPKPKHDEFSHHVSALEFFSICRYPLLSTGGVSVEKFR